MSIQIILLRMKKFNLMSTQYIMIELYGDECFKILDENLYIIFYFTASWCGPCKRVTPMIETIMKQYNSEKIRIYKIDIDNNENDDLCNKCHIESVPTFILIKDRRIIDSVKGANITKFQEMLDRLK